MTSTTEQVKMQVGNKRYPVVLEYVHDRIFVHFSYNKLLIAEIKVMEGAKYHGFDESNPRKIWSVLNSPRNLFQIEALKGNNPHAPYDVAPAKLEFKRDLKKHQKELVEAGCQYHCIDIGAEPGTGKSLVAIEIMERSNQFRWWWVAPSSAKFAVELECMKWKVDPRISIRFMTYEELTKTIKNWTDTDVPPGGIIFDESQKVKNPTAQRSQAAMIVANRMREIYANRQSIGGTHYVICMSGTPSPRSPSDWWHQCELTCPGFLMEGSAEKLRQRIAIVRNEESLTGGSYPKLLGWRDSENRCEMCGKLNNDPCHKLLSDPTYHDFVACENEVARLYRRMRGLVHIRLKKDCLDIPDKIYRVIELKPSDDLVRLAKVISRTSPRAITALTLLRELSDGFQYDTSQPKGTRPCPACYGTGMAVRYFDPANPESPATEETIQTGQAVARDCTCDGCGGEKIVPDYPRQAVEVGSPKDTALESLLDEYEDCGRVVVFAAFEASVDRCVSIAQRNKWSTIRVDARGWHFTNSDGLPVEMEPKQMLLEFQNKDSAYGPIAFIGHPGSGGTGITLTASPVIIYFSNSFNGEERMQSEDRIHRIGMDTNRGATIIDLIHLPSDRLILESYRKKAQLQLMSMGEIVNIMEEAKTQGWRL